MNVILIGMPGVGKSTIGVLLAKALGYSFVDTDLIIQAKSGRKLADIIAGDGADAFEALENEALESVEADKTVVATGGSAVFCAAGMEKLKSRGVAVYLRLPADELAKRLGNIRTRGVVMRDGIGMSLRDLYDERLPLYEKYADITVDVNDLSITAAARKVAAALK